MGEFKTKLELGVQLIEELELPEWVHLILITDGFYGPKKNFTLKLLPKGVDIISRLRIDAAVYENFIQETKKNVDVQKSMVNEFT